jgi:hypothetical protein
VSDDKVYDKASAVTATDRAVSVEGPDQVDVKLTPEAAEETADNLTEESVRARGQRRLKRLPHQPR